MDRPDRGDQARHASPSPPQRLNPLEGANRTRKITRPPHPLEGAKGGSPPPHKLNPLEGVKGESSPPYNKTVLTTRATLDKHHADVASMFDGVAKRYDLMKQIMTLGAVDTWRDLVVDAVEPEPGQTILDLAAGTGTSSATFAARGAQVYPTDISTGMLAVGKQRQPHLHFVAGDATCLPYADNSFDAVTISYGLRNVEDPHQALREMLRVAKPGGRVVICEFSYPTWAPFRHVYTKYLLAAIPAMARLASSNRQAYDYLAESILTWPDQPHLADMMTETGWQAVAWRNICGGVVALHRGWKGSVSPRSGDHHGDPGEGDGLR